MDFRAIVVACIAVLAVAGIALAAEAQKEEFLHEQEYGTGFAERASVSGNQVALTAFLVAIAFTVGALLLARGTLRRRWSGAPVIFLATYLIVLMIQTGMFQYVAEDALRSAVFSISPIVSNGAATPSTLLGPIAVLVVAGLGLQQAMRHMDGPTAQGFPGAPQPEREVPAIAGRFLGTMIIATPFVAATVLGNLRLLVALPHDQSATVPYLIVLPLAALAAAAMLVVGGVKAWQIAHASADPRMTIVAKEAWEGLRRAEWAILAVIAGLALLATILEPLPAGDVEAGAFNLNVRTHSQMQILLLLIFIPWMGMHRHAVQAFETSHTVDPRPARHLVIYWILVGVAVIAAGLATFLLSGALWVWLIVAAPLMVLALAALKPADSMMPALLAALILWGIGNTVTGFFQLNTTGRITWDTQPGLLAMWRSLAVVLIAVAVARSARGTLRDAPRPLAWPMVTGLGAAVAVLVFFELPFSAWIIHERQSEFVGIGTVIASQDPSVRATLHGISSVAGFLAGLAVSRIRRPDWFRRPEAARPHAFSERDAASD